MFSVAVVVFAVVVSVSVLHLCFVIVLEFYVVSGCVVLVYSLSLSLSIYFLGHMGIFRNIVIEDATVLHIDGGLRALP